LALMLTVVGTAMLTVSAALFILDLVQYRQLLQQNTLSLAEIMGRSCEAALVFNDPTAAKNVLQALERKPDVRAAYVLGKNHALFASYSKVDWQGRLLEMPAEVKAPTVDRDQGMMRVAVPVNNDDGVLGWIVLWTSLEAYHRRMGAIGGIMAAMLMTSFLLSWLILRKMQGFLIQPIQELVLASRLITQEGNYRFRVVKRSDDELGVLVDSFNEMLAQVQGRDAALIKVKDELEVRVGERTRELQGEVDERRKAQHIVNNLLMKISEDNEKLVKLDQMKSDFLSIVSHELRTPLTAITGYLKLLAGGAMGPLNEGQKEFIQTVLRNSDRLYNLVNDLLDLSRLEAGKVQLMFAPVDVGKILSNSIQGLRSLATQKRIDLSIAPTPEGLALEADSGRLEQVLVNLLGNSLKFTPEGGKVEVGAKADEREGRAGVVFWVKDSGVGIPEEALGRIFDKFYQVENSSVRKTGGTGLGLAITQKLVEAHHGAVWVESELGIGTTFWVFLPAKRGDPPLGLEAPKA